MRGEKKRISDELTVLKQKKAEQTKLASKIMTTSERVAYRLEVGRLQHDISSKTRALRQLLESLTKYTGTEETDVNGSDAVGGKKRKKYTRKLAGEKEPKEPKYEFR